MLEHERVHVVSGEDSTDVDRRDGVTARDRLRADLQRNEFRKALVARIKFLKFKQEALHRSVNNSSA